MAIDKSNNYKPLSFVITNPFAWPTKLGLGDRPRAPIVIGRRARSYEAFLESRPLILAVLEFPDDTAIMHSTTSFDVGNQVKSMLSSVLY
jgi:hypothetical protein